MRQRMAAWVAGIAALFAAWVPAIASASWDTGTNGGYEVPELDPSSAASAVTMLTGLLLVAHRVRRAR